MKLAFSPDPLGLLGVAPEDASHVFRVLRVRDLVNLHVSCFGLELVAGASGPVLRPVSRGARLEVRFPFQHLGEIAYAEEEGTIQEPVDQPPCRVRAAYGSRLVFALAEGDVVDYSSAGVLAAMSRLPLVVVPHATPRATASKVELADFVPIAYLGDGTAIGRAPEGLALVRAPRGAAPGAGTAEAASSARTARLLLAREQAVDLVPGRGSRFGAIAAELGDVVLPPVKPRPSRTPPRRPRTDQTAIEAPYRLLLSPSALGGFAHSLTPQGAAGDPDRVELWTTRLGTRVVRRDGTVRIDERPGSQRVVRAVWARDKDGDEPTNSLDEPFRMSLDGFDRVRLVRQTADPTVVPPQPVDVDRLALSAYGAWLDLHGRWDASAYGELRALSSWDHLATMGRDQHVEVAEPGYLFPFGHRCTLMTVTYRRLHPGSAGPTALLVQRRFLVVDEPVRSYAGRDLPFRQVIIRPQTTPDLADPTIKGTPHVVDGERVFWPVVAGQKFRFTLDCLDQDGRTVRLLAPLLYVDRARAVADRRPQLKRSKSKLRPAFRSGAHPQLVAAYETDDDIPADGQTVALAPADGAGTTGLEVQRLTFTARQGATDERPYEPYLVDAGVVLPAARHLGPAAPPVDVSYAKAYLDEGFAGDNAAGQLFLELAQQLPLSFSSGTDRAGGFLDPALPIRGVSRALGAVSDLAGTAMGAFDPQSLLPAGPGVLPKLFGLIPLTDLISAAGAVPGLDRAPHFVTEALDVAAALLRDVDGSLTALSTAATRLTADATAAATEPLRKAAEAARTELEALRTDLTDAVAGVTGLVDGALATGPADDFRDQLLAVLGDLDAALDRMEQVLRRLPLPAPTRALLERPVTTLRPVLAAGEALLTTVAAVEAFVRALDPAGFSVRARYDWTTPLGSWSLTSGSDPVFVSTDTRLLLSVDARVSAQDGPQVDVLAEISRFELNLVPPAPLLRLTFDRIAFRACTGRKPEVDIAFGGVRFVGLLGFVERLKELIPLDGFADPPYVDVSPQGVTAGFDLALPNVAIGAFSLQDLSLSADARVPFLGDHLLTVGFAFCTREKPFRLTVMAIGGGGFVGLRLAPEGLVLLEMALEAGAALSVDFGVASGSVSVMIGVYLRLEGDAGSLTGYVRIRGEVDVLGLVSASITLELALTYEFDTGKMVGRASIEVEVDVTLTSFSVTVTCERRLAGSNEDPTLAQQLGVAEDGTAITDVEAEVPAWAEHCAAFAAS